MSRTDSAQAVAAHAAELDLAAIPEPVIDAAKVSIFDTIGVMVGGLPAADIAPIRELAAEWGGTEESTVFGQSSRLPSYLATFVNGSLVHQLDFDDTHDTAVCHPAASALPAALALAEAKGGVHGSDLLAGFIAGTDLTSRLGLAIDGTLWDFPWVRAPVVGMFGAAVAGSRVIGLDSRGMLDALGLALPQVGGTLASLETPGSSVRTLRDGLAYKDAVLAVKLAESGVHGDRDVFDGAHGLFHAFFNGRYDREEIVADLGDRYETAMVSIKPWPSCRHTHGPLTAFFDALSREDESKEIAKIVVHVGPSNRRLFREGPEDGYPQGHADSLCNLRYAMAVAASKRAVLPQDFEQSHLGDEAVRSAYQKVVPADAPEFEVAGTIEPGWVEILFSDGTSSESRVDHALGHPRRPMSRPQLVDKFVTCCDFAGISDARPTVDKLVELVFDLENHSVDELIGTIRKLWS